MTLRQAHHRIELRTRGRALHAITPAVTGWLSEIAAGDGLVTLFVQHTSASLVVQENADPQVQKDLERFFARLVKDGDPLFEHTAEGPDDMPAHVRAALTQTHLAIPVRSGRPTLGTWQGIYLWEHRTHAHTRHVALHYLGM